MEIKNFMIDIIATVVMTIGPFAGIYMYIKNSNKLMSMATGAISKLGSGLVNASNKWAGNMRERSTYGQIMANRKNIGNIRAQQRSFERMKKSSAWGGLATGMMNEEKQRLMTTRIDKAMAGIQMETIEAHTKNLNRPAAEIISEGRLSSDGRQYQDKKNKAVWHSVDKLDDLTKSALTYARTNNLTETDEGVKAIATKLYEFGGMNASHVTNLAAMAKDKAAFMEYSAGQAAKTGMGHLKFATVTTPDKNNPNQYQIDFGGALGGGTDKVTDKLVSGGLHNISKDTWSDEDPAFAAAFAQSVIDQRNQKREVYEQGLAKMTDEQVSKMIGALNRSNNPTASQLAAQLVVEHNQAINKFKP